MRRGPGIVWIFLRVLMTAVGVFVAAAVVSWIARLLMPSERRVAQKQPAPPAGHENTEPAPPAFREEDIVDVPYSEVEELPR